jgi:hypothetical protein
MRRISCEERPDWRARAEETGFDFHTLDGQRYWDERAYYAFTFKEIEQDLEAPTAELEKMSRELVARIIADERLMRRLAIPVRFWNWIVRSWKNPNPASMVASTCVTAATVRQSCWSTTPIRRHRCSRPAYSSGCGLGRQSSAKCCRKMPTNSIRCTSD